MSGENTTSALVYLQFSSSAKDIMTNTLTYELAWSCEHCGRSGVVRVPVDVTSPKERWEACVEAHKSYCRYKPYVGPASVRSKRYPQFSSGESVPGGQI